MVRKSIAVEEYTGLDLLTPRILMRGGAGRSTWNIGYERLGAARIRAGFSRLVVPNDVDTPVTYSRSSVASDNFNSATNADPLQNRTGWVTTNFNDANLVETLVSGGAGVVALHSKLSLSACVKRSGSYQTDQYAAYKIIVQPTSHMGAALRIGTAGGYAISASGGVVTVFRFTLIDGLVATLATYSVATAVGDTFWLEVLGTTLSAYKESTLLGTCSDSTYNSGVPGVFFDAFDGGSGYTPGRLDDFAAGNMAATYGTPTSAAAATRLFAFERDDDEVLVVVPNGNRVDAYPVGQPEWSA